ncbi:MmgE/PrpD family protein [Aliisedimentitalea scapharcae]|uniref:MmgE/PrpD family protein n=1 Tax=Aliisedimentitalea scapharcae TaxID=1524259 RepID=A0ABZ2XYM9_9RHOB
MAGTQLKAAEFIHGLKSTDLPPAVLHMARRCLVDTIAIWVAGMETDTSRIARDHAVRRYGGALAMPFDGRLVNPVGFAFAGAATIDAIDGHDGHQSCKGHASVALVPTVLAELGADPAGDLDDLLTHLVVGHEIAIRSALSLHATVPDYHSSGAWNALGCAAIAARLRGLGHDGTRHALGIAEYYGPRAQMMRCIDHPSMVKDSSAWGALTGVSAADLAEDGFTGAPAITCEAPEVAEIWADLGHRWRILESNFKAYPICRWGQPPVEAVLTLMQDHEVAFEDVTEILVTTFHEATRLASRRPADGDTAQYSLPLAVALALRHATILPDHLLPGCYDQPEIWKLVDQVCFAESDDYNAAFPDERFADVTLSMRDGRRLVSEAAVARGNFDAPLADAELVAKLDHYGTARLSTEARQQIASILSGGAPAPSLRDLIACLHPQAS